MSIHNRLDVCKPFLGLFEILFAPRSTSERTPAKIVSRAETAIKPSVSLSHEAKLWEVVA